MDPFTVLGTTAAALQFAELAVKSISKLVKLSHDLEDVPRRLRDQLQDVERSMNQLREFSAELDRDPRTASSLSPPRLGSLKLAVETWLVTAGLLESRLDQLLNSGSPSKKKHQWRDLKIAYKSVSQSEDIERDIQRIERLSNQIWGELLQTLLVNQLEIRPRIQDAEVTLCSRLQHVSQRLHDEQSDNRAHFTNALKGESDNIQAALNNLTASLATNFDQLDSQTTRGHEMTADKINARISDEFRMLRTFMSATSSVHHAAIDIDRDDSQNPLSLVQGGPLRNTHHEAVSSSNDQYELIPTLQSTRSLTSKPHTNPRLCCCPKRFRSGWQVSKRLRLRYQAVAHSLSCPHASTTQQSRTVSIYVQLPRLLGPSFEILLTTSPQRNVYTFSQTITFFPIVNRSKSPIFAEFDTINGLWKRKRSSTWGQNEVETFKCLIRNLPGKLQRITATGAGSCRDKDEFGNTLLLETAYFMIGGLSRLHDLSSELCNLLCFLRTVGLDTSATGYHVSHRRQLGLPIPEEHVNYASPYVPWATCKFTAKSLAIILSQLTHDSFPLYDHLKGFDFEDDWAVDSEFQVTPLISGHSRASQRFQTVKLLRKHTELASGVLVFPLAHFIKRWVELIPRLSDLGDLEGLIVEQELTKLRSLLERFDLQKYTTKWIHGNLDLSAFQLAMDWHEGIQELLLSGLSPTSADIEFAIYLNNTDLMETLWGSLCEPLHYPRVFELLVQSSNKCQEQFVNLLRTSRSQLCLLGEAHLDKHVREFLNLTSGSVLDSKSLETWTLLMSQGFSVPQHLHPGQQSTVFKVLSTKDLFYQDFHHKNRATTQPSHFFQKLYDYGFVEVDCQTEDRREAGIQGSRTTPLEVFLSSSTGLWRGDLDREFTIFADVCLWFLKHHASPSLSKEHLWPNILFYLARLVCMDPGNFGNAGNSAHFLDHFTQHHLWDAALDKCSANQTDECQCFCSTDGCLPSRSFLQDEKILSRPCLLQRPAIITMSTMCTNLLLWFSLCRLRHQEEVEYVRDHVRLALFDRLGMTHTCCKLAKISLSSGSPHFHSKAHEYPVPCSNETDADEIRDEEVDLKEQLDLLLTAYDAFISGFENWSDGLAQWWMLVDKVLPDVSHLEWNLGTGPTDVDLDQEVSELERNTLESNGYGGMDFIDVIRSHFGEYLTKDDMISGSSAMQ